MKTIHGHSDTTANSATPYRPRVPWLAILTNKSVLACMFARFTINITFQLLQTKLPAYLNDVLHVPHTKNGLLNSVLWGCIMLTMSTGGLASEQFIRRGWLSRKNTRRLFAVVCE